MFYCRKHSNRLLAECFFTIIALINIFEKTLEPPTDAYVILPRWRVIWAIVCSGAAIYVNGFRWLTTFYAQFRWLLQFRTASHRAQNIQTRIYLIDEAILPAIYLIKSRETQSFSR